MRIHHDLLPSKGLLKVRDRAGKWLISYQSFLTKLYSFCFLKVKHRKNAIRNSVIRASFAFFPSLKCKIRSGMSWVAQNGSLWTLSHRECRGSVRLTLLFPRRTQLMQFMESKGTRMQNQNQFFRIWPGLTKSGISAPHIELPLDFRGLWRWTWSSWIIYEWQLSKSIGLRLGRKHAASSFWYTRWGSSGIEATALMKICRCCWCGSK